MRVSGVPDFSFGGTSTSWKAMRELVFFSRVTWNFANKSCRTSSD